MTAHQAELALALERCTFSPGSTPKRFVRWAASIARTDPARGLSPKAAAFLELLAHSYRRQLGRCMAERCEKCEAVARAAAATDRRGIALVTIRPCANPGRAYVEGMSKTSVDLETARKCAKGAATYDPARGGYTCDGCGRHFQRSYINAHTRAARRRIEHADVVVRP